MSSCWGGDLKQGQPVYWGQNRTFIKMRFLSPTSYCHKTKQVVGYPFHWQMRDQESLWALRPLVLFSGSCIRSQEGPRGSLGQTLGSILPLPRGWGYWGQSSHFGDRTEDWGESRGWDGRTPASSPQCGDCGLRGLTGGLGARRYVLVWNFNYLFIFIIVPLIST